jgi:hypothetical protein
MRSDEADEHLRTERYAQIGKLKVELHWLQKKSVCRGRRTTRVDRGRTFGISMVRQCELAGISRSAVDYDPRGESELNLKLMRLLDEPVHEGRRSSV